jgi:hypothetical protein
MYTRIGTLYDLIVAASDGPTSAEDMFLGEAYGTATENRGKVEWSGVQIWLEGLQ